LTNLLSEFNFSVVKTLAFYVSGHGLGHIARQCIIIDALLKTDPTLTIYIRTKAHPWFAKEKFGDRVFFESVQCDTGVHQIDSLNLLKKDSLADFETFYKNSNGFYKRELQFIQKKQINLIITDFSPFALVLGKKASLPVIGCSNFTWDFIYEPYTKEFPGYQWIPEIIREMHAHCTLMLRFPFHHPYSGFPLIKDLPITANISRLPQKEIRKRLNLPANKPCVLLSFGGFSIHDFQSKWIEYQQDVALVAAETTKWDVPGLTNLKRKTIQKAELHYCDLVKMADVVITKPGYGIVTDCWANGTGMIYTSRGEFAEYPILVNLIRQTMHAVFIKPEILRAGKIEAALHEYFGQERAFKPNPAPGGERAAEEIAKFL